jgi:hypothetical protein
MTGPEWNPATQQQAAGNDIEHDDPGADPEREGIPEHADDDTPANRQVPEPRRLPVPGDRPIASDDYGTTATETRRGEPLSGRLARERPDVGEDTVPDERAYDRTMRAEPTGTDEVAEASVDADVLGDGTAEDPALESTMEGDDPRTESPVSVYDRMDRAAATGEPVGELVAPDQGAHPDRERDEIARQSDRTDPAPESDAVRDEGPGR